MTPAPFVATAALVFTVATSPLLAVQQPGSGGTGNEGERLYRTYCASCHGMTGRGDGPVASELRTAPADLTDFAARNRGVFPSQLLRSIIDGRGIRAHGLDEMPVWGDAFRSEAEGLSQQQVLERIDAIVRYLESIQVRSARLGESGNDNVGS